MKEREKAHAQRAEQPTWRELLSAVLGSGRHGRQTLQRLLQLAGERNNLPSAETLEMMGGVLRIADRQVRDIMVPRIHMHVLRENAGIEEWISAVAESGHSRFPVLKEDSEQVTGILLAKDLLTLAARGADRAREAHDRIRRAYFVPESKRLNLLLREFRNSRSHMAIVVDEYGGISGLVTIEDIIEEIVGEIEDEHDRETQAHIRPKSSERFEIDGLTPLEEFNDYFHTRIEGGDYDTVGGLVLKQFDRMPEAGEAFEIQGLRFEVLEADKRRVLRIGLRRLPAARAETETGTGTSDYGGA